MTLYQFLSNGGLSKTMSIVITTIITLGAAVVIGIQIVQGVTPNPLAEGIVFATLGGSLNLIGVHTGIANTITGLNAAVLNPAPVNPPALVEPASTVPTISNQQKG